MKKSGFAQILPIFIVGLLVIGALTAVSFQKENSQKQAVGKVLSDKSGGDDHGGSSGGGSSSGGGDHGGGSSNSSSGSNNSSNSNSSSGSGGTFQKVEPAETQKPQERIEIHPQEAQAEVKSKEKVDVETENDKTKTKIETANLHIEVETEGGKVVTKIKDEAGKEVELKKEAENEVLQEAENELEKDHIRIATASAELGFIQNGKRVRTDFPLSVNTKTGGLFVKTPSGDKEVTILPDEAVQNMIRAGVITHLDDTVATVIKPKPGASGAGQLDLSNSAIELKDDSGKLVFEVKGVKNQKLLGLVPVDLKVKTVVSAENGQLLGVQESLFTKILDLLSF